MPQPNIVIFIADDMGWADYRAAGATDLQTPHLDRLAAGGARCTHWYGGAPVCSASRAALLTGCDPWRVNVPGNIAPLQPEGVEPLATPLPAAFRDAGYRTCMSGKWHLGEGPTCNPAALGFDDWFGFLSGCVDFYSHTFYWGAIGSGGKQHPRHDLFDNGREVFRNGQYMTGLIRDRAVAQVRDAAAHDRPFFLYVPFNAPHYPLHAPQPVLQRFAHLPRDRQLMAAMIYAMDQAVGAVLDELDAQGVADHTLVLFTGDHGPSREPRNHEHGRDEPYFGGSTAGLRGAKFDVYEGGIRVPGIVRLPGVVPAGSVIDAPIRHQDVQPTLMRLAGLDIPDTMASTWDGADAMPLLTGGTRRADSPMRWRYRRQAAVRLGDWKLVVEAGQAALYNLAEDPGELAERSEEHPKRMADMLAALDG